MAAEPGQEAPDRHALVSAFVGHVGGGRARTGAKILGAVLVAALIGGAVVGVGYMTRPAKKHPVAATGRGQPSAPVAPSPAASPPQASPAPAPAPAPTETVTVEAPPAPIQTVTVQAAPAAAPPEAVATPVQAPATPTPPAVRAGTATNFAAVTGYGCPQSQKATFAEHGWWSDGLNGFIAEPGGGPRTDGCDGSFYAMPMSGSATLSDPANYAVWTFLTAPLIRAHCHIDVYVPNDPSIRHVGGNPAFYQVFNSATATGTPLGSFDIDQHFNQDRWASRHNWLITGGALTIKLLSRGIDWAGNSQTHAHIAVSAVSLTCAP